MTRKCELGSPVMRDRATVVRTFVHLVIPNHRNVRNRCVEPSTCSEPLTPFAVRLCRVDQITSMKQELGLRSIAVSLSDNPRPHRTDIVLSVSEVDEGKRFLLYFGRFELKPLAPIQPVTNTVCIFGTRG